MYFSKICKILDAHGLKYEIIGDSHILVYCYAYSNDYDLFLQFGKEWYLVQASGVQVVANIKNIKEWLGY